MNIISSFDKVQSRGRALLELECPQSLESQDSDIADKYFGCR